MQRLVRSRILVFLLILGGLAAAGFAWQEWRSATVVVEWSTASELDAVGFNLYRSEQPDGGYTQVNTSVIPATGDALTGGEYRYEDREVQAGHTYYYTLEEVTASGTGERYGPITVKAQGRIGAAAVTALVLLGSALLLWSGKRPPQDEISSRGGSSNL